MKSQNFMKVVLSFTLILLWSLNSAAQELDKVLFVKPVQVKHQSKTSYNFLVGYVATEDRKIALEFSGGPSKFWSHRNVQVKKGKGIIPIALNPKDNPAIGKGYRLILAIREKDGGWQTNKAGFMITNIEMVKEDIRFSDNASFSVATPNVVESTNSYTFDIDCIFKDEHIIQVSIWNDKDWVATSKKITVAKGNTTQKVEVKLEPPVEGNKYRYVLTFGKAEDFDNKTYVQKEFSGIVIKKGEKKLTVKEINEKSIQISVNKNKEILTLPGKASYETVKVISMSGQIIIEKKNTNSVRIAELNKGAYFAVTSEGDYFKFVKF